MLGGRGRAAFSGTGCRAAPAQWGCDPTLASAVLTSAQSVHAAQVVLCCPSSSACPEGRLIALTLKRVSDYPTCNAGESSCEQTAKSSGKEGGKGHKKECDTLKEKWEVVD